MLKKISTLTMFFVVVQERLAHLKRHCQPHLTEVAKESVESICLKWYHTCCDNAKKIAELNTKIMKEQGIVGRYKMFI